VRIFINYINDKFINLIKLKIYLFIKIIIHYNKNININKLITNIINKIIIKKLIKKYNVISITKIIKNKNKIISMIKI